MIGLVTAGAAIVAAASARMERGDATGALLLDACGSAAAEEAADRISAAIVAALSAGAERRGAVAPGSPRSPQRALAPRPETPPRSMRTRRDGLLSHQPRLWRLAPRLAGGALRPPAPPRDRRAPRAFPADGAAQVGVVRDVAGRRRATPRRPLRLRPLRARELPLPPRTPHQRGRCRLTPRLELLAADDLSALAGGRVPGSRAHRCPDREPLRRGGAARRRRGGALGPALSAPRPSCARRSPARRRASRSAIGRAPPSSCSAPAAPSFNPGSAAIYRIDATGAETPGATARGLRAAARLRPPTWSRSCSWSTPCRATRRSRPLSSPATSRRRSPIAGGSCSRFATGSSRSSPARSPATASRRCSPCSLPSAAASGRCASGRSPSSTAVRPRRSPGAT